MNLNYSLAKTIGVLMDSIINFSFMQIIIICSVILCIILFINKKISKYIISSISIILFVLIIYYYHGRLISNNTFKYIMHNIRFYFLNSILYLIIINVAYYKLKSKFILNIIFCISFVLLSFSLFMTHYVHNIELITLGNIYPMIVFGNYLYVILYVYLLISLVSYLIMKKKA